MKKIAYATAFVFMAGAFAFAAYSDALKLYQDKKYQESLGKIAGELVVGRDTDAKSSNYELRFLAAHNHWKLGNYEAAIAHFKRCAEIQKDIADPLLDLALLLAETGKYREAELHVTRALAMQKSALGYYIIGKSAYGVGNFWKAKEFYEKAIGLDPGLYIAYNGLGCALMKLSRYAHANTAFSAALSVMPSSPEILNNMGLCLEKMGKRDEAVGYYEKAAGLTPQNPVIRQNLNRVKENKK
jgi:tetratricopeptide (TPR) repeat protein